MLNLIKNFLTKKLPNKNESIQYVIDYLNSCEESEPLTIHSFKECLSEGTVIVSFSTPTYKEYTFELWYNEDGSLYGEW